MATNTDDERSLSDAVRGQDCPTCGTTVMPYREACPACGHGPINWGGGR